MGDFSIVTGVLFVLLHSETIRLFGNRASDVLFYIHDKNHFGLFVDSLLLIHKFGLWLN